ncbi:hypothetical protein H5410_035449 [Solanum commersonii]|uniref:Uncharacterized protein n=1 Tax=Solanum commersonii TaxID=4109 RepID=A0A9J5Y1A5_SOLCO|nr:hypothetical protein H5410_035449 [Solanum commersonii]
MLPVWPMIMLAKVGSPCTFHHCAIIPHRAIFLVTTFSYLYRGFFRTTFSYLSCIASCVFSVTPQI